MSNKDAIRLFAGLSAAFVAASVGLGAYAGTLGNEVVALAALVLGTVGAAIGAGLTAYRNAGD